MEEDVRAFRKRAAASVLSDKERKLVGNLLTTHTHTHTGRLTQRLEPLAVVVNIDVDIVYIVFLPTLA